MSLVYIQSRLQSLWTQFVTTISLPVIFKICNNQINLYLYLWKLTHKIFVLVPNN